LAGEPVLGELLDWGAGHDLLLPVVGADVAVPLGEEFEHVLGGLAEHPPADIAGDSKAVRPRGQLEPADRAARTELDVPIQAVVVQDGHAVEVLRVAEEVAVRICVEVVGHWSTAWVSSGHSRRMKSPTGVPRSSSRYSRILSRICASVSGRNSAT